MKKYNNSRGGVGSREGQALSILSEQSLAIKVYIYRRNETRELVELLPVKGGPSLVLGAHM